MAKWGKDSTNCRRFSGGIGGGCQGPYKLADRAGRGSGPTNRHARYTAGNWRRLPSYRKTVVNIARSQRLQRRCSGTYFSVCTRTYTNKTERASTFLVVTAGGVPMHRINCCRYATLPGRSSIHIECGWDDTLTVRDVNQCPCSSLWFVAATLWGGWRSADSVDRDVTTSAPEPHPTTSSVSPC